MRHVFVKRLELARSAHDVFAWHEQPEALKKLIPPGDPVRVVDHRMGKQGPIGDNARVLLEMGQWPLRMRWVAMHEGFIQDRQFIDVQVHGPFAFWRHTHSIAPVRDDACVLEDHVEYEVPFGALGDAVAHRTCGPRSNECSRGGIARPSGRLYSISDRKMGGSIILISSLLRM